MPLRMRPRRRLISLSPRYLLTWQCRRLSTVSTPHLWMLRCRRSHTVLFLRTFPRRWVLAQLLRFLLTCLFRLLHAVLCYTTPPQNYRSRSSLLDVSSRTILLIVSARHRHKAILVVSHCLHFLTLLRPCTLSSSSLDSDDLVRTLAPRALLQPPPGVEQFAPPPGLAIDAHLCTPHGIPVSAAPLRPRLRSAISVTPPQPPACTNTSCAISYYRQEKCQYCSGQSKPDGHGYIDTADSDLMHHQYRFSVLQWNPGPARRNPTNIIAAACGKFHAVILQEASDHVPHLRSVHGVHWQHGPRYLAQQGHL